MNVDFVAFVAVRTVDGYDWWIVYMRLLFLLIPPVDILFLLL